MIRTQLQEDIGSRSRAVERQGTALTPSWLEYQEAEALALELITQESAKRPASTTVPVGRFQGGHQQEQPASPQDAVMCVMRLHNYRAEGAEGTGECTSVTAYVKPRYIAASRPPHARNPVRVPGRGDVLSRPRGACAVPRPSANHGGSRPPRETFMFTTPASPSLGAPDLHSRVISPRMSRHRPAMVKNGPPPEGPITEISTGSVYERRCKVLWILETMLRVWRCPTP